MNEINEIIKEIIKFRDEREWAQFHDSKNLASAISIEASELNELFLWKTTEESEKVDKTKIKEELADILIFSFLLAHRHNYNIQEIIMDKIHINAKKYPIKKSKGKHTKYTDL